MKVAVIGGGISGLATSRALSSAGIETTLFDTGKKVVGGRCSSREVMIDGKRIIMDHAAQYLALDPAVSHPAYVKFVGSLVDQGVLREWCSQIADIGNDGSTPNQSIITERNKKFVCIHGMGYLPVAMSVGLSVNQNVWVNRLERVDKKWRVFGNRQSFGDFDKVVIAHNGKCADRLVSSVREYVPAIHERLRVNFGPEIKNPRSMRKMHLCSLYVLVFVIRGRLPSAADAYNIESNESNLSWICNTSRKLKRSVDTSDANVGNEDDFESWTIISSRQFAAENKVPQESIPKETEACVTQTLLQDFERTISLPIGSVKPEYTKLQVRFMKIN